jgi:hypothetical protein
MDKFTSNTIKGLGAGMLGSLIIIFVLLFCFQMGRTYQAHEIRTELKACNVGNICHVHSLDMTLPLFMGKAKDKYTK